MMKKLMTIVALMCAIAFQANAQDNNEEWLKAALQASEELVKEADQNPQNGRKQLAVAEAFSWDGLGDKQDLDRALIYANKALKIAEAQTVMKDTLMGRTCHALGVIYHKKQDLAQSLTFYERAIKAFEEELGRYDPVSIYEKLFAGYIVMTNNDARRGSLFIQQGFLDSEMAPAEKRLKNIENLSALYEMAVDFMVADISLRMQRGAPLISFEGKKYYMLQTPEWNIEQPIVGWFVPRLVRSADGESPKGDVILLDAENPDNDLRVITPDYPNRPSYEVGFSLDQNDHQTLQIPDENARLFFFDEPSYKFVLEKYHALKDQQK